MTHEYPYMTFEQYHPLSVGSAIAEWMNGFRPFWSDEQIIRDTPRNQGIINLLADYDTPTQTRILRIATRLFLRKVQS